MRRRGFLKQLRGHLGFGDSKQPRGADFKISRHVFMRAEYRDLVYNSSAWNLESLDGTNRITHLAEPSVGFGYRF